MICRKIEDYKGTDGILRHNMVFFGVKGVYEETLTEDYITPEGYIYKKGEKVRRSVFIDNGASEYLIADENYITSNVGMVSVRGKPTTSYANGVDGVCQSLMQRLTLVQGELKHYMRTGFPLLAKNNSKQVLDAYLVQVILCHPDVKDIISLESKVKGHDYIADISVNTIYGKVAFTESM